MRWGCATPGWAGSRFVGAVLGFCTGMSMIWFMNGFDYPLVVGGKPLFSPVFAFPVSYELTILFGAFGAIIGMLIMNRAAPVAPSGFNSPQFVRATHDRFFIILEWPRSEIHRGGLAAVAGTAGGREIERVKGKLMRYFFIFLLLTVATVISIAGFRGARFRQPPLEVFPT